MLPQSIEQGEDNTVAWARRYRECGFSPIPILNGKNPGFPNWQKFHCTDEEIDACFRSVKNIGILLGLLSNGLADVDLDTSYAVAAASHFLPETGLISGHDERPRSHYLYRIVDPGSEIQPNVKPEKFAYTIGEDETTVVELRGNGQQSIVAPSLHPDYTEEVRYRWDAFGEPFIITYSELRRRVAFIAIAATLAEHWPSPGRHDTGLKVAGLLYSCGVHEDDARRLVEIAATIDGHRRVADRVHAVTDTYRKARADRAIKGIPSLAEVFPSPVVNALKKWCGSIATEKRDWWDTKGNGAVFQGDGRGSNEDTLSGANENPWARAKAAPEFLAEEEKEFTGLAKDLVVPGAITLIDSPKGIGKTQLIHALIVALATGGVFRGEQVTLSRVLLLDRENPVATLKQRLRAWGAAGAKNLRVLTRQDAPDLKDRRVWAQFPVEDYDVVVIDSVGASTEGITEKEGKQNSEVLATLLDLAHRNIGIILLQNTEKTGTNIRGRGEWADRADIQFEVRDATGFVPSGKRPWWLELPADGAANWAERAARRKGRTDYRLAFIPAKFRLAAEPEPFCVELQLAPNVPWTLRDVTEEILQTGEETVRNAENLKNAKLKTAADALTLLVKERVDLQDPILKTEAETFLQDDYKLTQKASRLLISERDGVRWQIKPLPSGRGKGTPKALFPITASTSEGHGRQSNDPGENPDESGAREEGNSVDPMNTGNKEKDDSEPARKADSEEDFTSSAEESRATEKTSQEPLSNASSRKGVYSVDEENETRDATFTNDARKEELF